LGELREKCEVDESVPATQPLKVLALKVLALKVLLEKSLVMLHAALLFGGDVG
jgi:hypothetical protein